MSDEPTDDESTDDVAETFLQDSGPGRDEMASDYLPGDDEWLGKTNLDTGDPAAIAALRNFAEIYPEVDDLQPLIDGALDELLIGRTSVGGVSRQEYKDILEGMYGGKSEDGQGTAMQLVAPDDD